jgi:phosphatidylglycerol:prolipoprotein diacylglycerol transferase
MLSYPNLSPVAFHIGSWPIYWYGLMYLIGFASAWALLSWRAYSSPRGFTQDQVSDLIFYGALGVVIGGRLGYMFFYDLPSLVASPLLLLQVWKGGMSFHGGLIGVLIAMWIFARKHGKPFLALTDFVAPVVPLGLGAGRIGNFINGELWGRVTDSSWGMIFPQAGPLPRHPSQLYEFALEGVLLFCILYFYSRKPRPLGMVSGLLAVGYGVFRCIVEMFREPDIQVGYFFGWVTEGQLLSVPLIMVGIALMIWSQRKGQVV